MPSFWSMLLLRIGLSLPCPHCPHTPILAAAAAYGGKMARAGQGVGQCDRHCHCKAAPATVSNHPGPQSGAGLSESRAELRLGPRAESLTPRYSPTECSLTAIPHLASLSGVRIEPRLPTGPATFDWRGTSLPPLPSRRTGRMAARRHGRVAVPARQRHGVEGGRRRGGR